MRRKTAKTLLTLLLALTMCVGLWPAQAQAANYQTGTQSPRVQSSPEALVIQAMEELIYGSMETDYALTEDYYAPEVLQQINRIYDETMQLVREHPEEIQVMGMWIVLPEEISVRMETLEMLVPLTKDVFYDGSDIRTLKKNLQDQYGQITRHVTRGSYNDWYWDKYTAQRDSAKKKLDAITDLSSYVQACQEPLFITFRELIEPEDDDSLIWIIYDEGEGGNSLWDYLAENDIAEESILTKTQLAQIIDIGQQQLMQMLDDAVQEKLFTPSAALRKNLKGFRAEAAQQEDHNEILRIFDEKQGAYEEAYEKAKMAQLAKDTSQRLSGSDILRWETKMHQKYFSYDLNKYSEDAFARLAEIRDEYTGDLWDCETQKEAQKLWNRYLAALKKVPLLSAELKAARTKTAKSWKKTYTNGKKYDQKKVRKLLKQGKAALAKADTMEKFRQEKAAYTKKLKACIRSFPVKIRKQGKGTVTPGKRVSYGKSYVLKITPAPGKALKSVTINGQKQKKLKYTYRVKITKKTNIRVTFR